jgi:hypothetical protein
MKITVGDKTGVMMYSEEGDPMFDHGLGMKPIKRGNPIKIVEASKQEIEYFINSFGFIKLTMRMKIQDQIDDINNSPGCRLYTASGFFSLSRNEKIVEWESIFNGCELLIRTDAKREANLLMVDGNIGISKRPEGCL